MRLTSRVRGALVAAVVVAGALAGASAASALDGAWNAHKNCPVDDPVMLASPVGADTSCVAMSFADGGQISVGNRQMQLPNLALEFGVANATQGDLGTVRGPTLTTYFGSSRVSLAPLGAVCPPPDFRDPLQWEISALCAELLNGLTSIPVDIQLAGTPSAYDPAALRATGAPIITLPIKLQIQNPVLGPSCYVGSDQDPIVIHLIGIDAGYDISTYPDPHGFPVTHELVTSGHMEDSSFAEPGATGCGPAGLLDGVVNGLFGLPSPAGQNAFVAVRNVSTARTTAGGQVLSDAWHAAAN